jgi:hypothetical protein
MDPHVVRLAGVHNTMIHQLARPFPLAKMQVGLHVKCLLFSFDLDQNWYVSTDCTKSLQSRIS